jgi:tetratricopeptide (TPR) repeat protein
MIEIAQTMGDTGLHIQALLDLAESLNRREVKSEARDVYKQVLEIDPENVTAQEMLAAIEEPKDFIDLGAVLRTEIADDHRPGVPQSMQDLISQFRQEVFESIGEGDHHSRYDLGVAYKGMGLYQEAIEEFEIAAKDVTLKLKALEMISSCFLERGKIDDAVRTLEEGLKVTSRPKREFFGIHFLLGQCYEKKKQMREALKQYLAAYRIDKSVPDLTHRMNELKRKLEAELKKKRKKTARKKTEAKKAKSGVEKIEAKKSKITYL